MGEAVCLVALEKRRAEFAELQAEFMGGNFEPEIVRKIGDIQDMVNSAELHLKDSGGIIEALSTLSQKCRRELGEEDNHTVARIAPEEEDRVPMMKRGVTLAFLRRIVLDLAALGRPYIDTGQFSNGEHTTSGETDYKEFDSSRDGYSGKACTLFSGTSFVETCMKLGLTHDPKTGEPYFGTMNTFIW